MSHYYLASPGQLQQALVQHCERWDAEQAQLFKKLLQDFLDGPASIEHRVRVEVKDPVLPAATIAGDAKESP